MTTWSKRRLLQFKYMCLDQTMHLGLYMLCNNSADYSVFVEIWRITLFCAVLNHMLHTKQYTGEQRTEIQNSDLIMWKSGQVSISI